MDPSQAMGRRTYMGHREVGLGDVPTGMWNTADKSRLHAHGHLEKPRMRSNFDGVGDNASALDKPRELPFWERVENERREAELEKQKPRSNWDSFKDRRVDNALAPSAFPKALQKQSVDQDS